MSEIWVNDGSLKTVGVTIVKENSKGERQAIEVWGEEAEKWGKAIESQSVYCYTYGMKFPILKWKVIE